MCIKRDEEGIYHVLYVSNANDLWGGQIWGSHIGVSSIDDALLLQNEI